MVDINSASSSPVDPWASARNDDDDQRRRAAPAIRTATTRDLSELPDMPDTNGALLARAVRSVAVPHLVLATGLTAGEVAPCVEAATATVPLVKQRLDGFKGAATPTYHVPGAGDLAVATPFRMQYVEHLIPQERNDPGMVRYAEQESRVRSHPGELEAIAVAHGIPPGRLAAIQLGRGTPEDVRRLTQALIDAGKLPPACPGADTPYARVRQMMCDHGIGLDCAGYVQQAFLAAHGITRAQAGFAATALGEGLFDPAANGRLARVSPEKAEPGDIVVLRAPEGERFGHRLIVYDRHEIQPVEVNAFHASPEDAATLRSGRVSVFHVDSSWGSGADPKQGGVLRQTWLYDATGNRWGTVVDNHARFTSTGLPYDGRHALGGIYHYGEGR